MWLPVKTHQRKWYQRVDWKNLNVLPKFAYSDGVKRVGEHSNTNGNNLYKGYKFSDVEFLHKYQGR